MQKGTIGILLHDEDMPSTEDGIRPSLIMNPHSIPSRMTVGQLIESMSGNVCAETCSQIDATIFKKTDIESIAVELETLGLDRYGYRRLYSGITGEYIDCEIFMGPVFYQRLQKFTLDTQYATTAGPSDAITYRGKLVQSKIKLWLVSSQLATLPNSGKVSLLIHVFRLI